MWEERTKNRPNFQRAWVSRFHALGAGGRARHGKWNERTVNWRKIARKWRGRAAICRKYVRKWGMFKTASARNGRAGRAWHGKWNERTVNWRKITGKWREYALVCRKCARKWGAFKTASARNGRAGQAWHGKWNGKWNERTVDWRKITGKWRGRAMVCRKCARKWGASKPLRHEGKTATDRGGQSPARRRLSGVRGPRLCTAAVRNAPCV